MLKKSMVELNRPNLSALPGSKMPVVVVLEDIRSGLNIGSVFRTADAFNVKEIILSGYSVTPPHREILKTALDSTQSVQWQYTDNLEHRLRGLKEAGYFIAAVEQVHQSRPLQAVNLRETTPLVLIFGNEVHGVSEAALNLCDFAIEIPQSGIKHSLNIAVCAGVVLWHCYHQLELKNMQ